jgi:hypothetical protein
MDAHTAAPVDFAYSSRESSVHPHESDPEYPEYPEPLEPKSDPEYPEYPEPLEPEYEYEG